MSPSADVPELFGAGGRGRGRTEAPSLSVSPSVIFCVSAPATHPTGLRDRVLRLKSRPPPPPSLFIYPPAALFAAFFLDRISRGKPREREVRKRELFLYDVCFIFGTITNGRHRHHLRLNECVLTQGLPLIVRQRRSSLQGCQSPW